MYGIDSGFLIFWGLAAIFMGFVWTAKGRNFLVGAILSLGLSPLISLLILLLSGDGKQRMECPQCKERVIVGAAICPHCRTPLEWQEVKPRAR